MKQTSVASLLLALGITGTLAQQGPFSPDDWPATADASKEVHYVVTDPDAIYEPLGNNWFEGDLTVLSGGDQATRSVVIGGARGTRVLGNYLNIADAFYFDWADKPVIDILIQFYGDDSILAADGTPRNFDFLTGTLPDGPDGNLNNVTGGTLPVEANNGKWNWGLFRIENGIRPDGGSYVDQPADNAQGNISAGGVNGGTIRFQGVPGLTVRVVAFGEEGAFGEPEEINQFLDKDFCEPPPETNHVWIDLANETADHLELLDNGDQNVSIATNIGPAGDRRRAATVDGMYMNFGITEEYLGKACNDPVVVKVCVEYYDDPELTGISFGPEAFATDAQGGIDIFPANKLWVTQGSGEWRKIAFRIPDVNLKGVNTGNLTGGPRLMFETTGLYVSRVDMAILRDGEHPLAGQDPLTDCFEDPAICTDLYGNFAEYDLHNEIQNGLGAGNNGGDQEMITEEAGPDGDRRLAVRPAMDDGTPGFPHIYMNFAIQDEVFGPTSQPNAHISICVTYYDDPELTGATFRPEVYQTELGGLTTFGFTPGDRVATLEGTGTWREAYFEIPNLKFNGVNQGPQAAARFVFTDKIYFTRIQYGVIRPCGPFAGINPLEECKPMDNTPALAISRTEAGEITIQWPGDSADFQLESTSDLNSGAWSPFPTEPTTVDGTSSVTIQVTETTFFQLISQE
ncbi:MAG: hypothetical protein O2964_05840 [Verrucomicrobia bacterium]|jgi:hypothetical protein|nr:hypothetical protein [Verrucomicrobiota bacterium]